MRKLASIGGGIRYSKEELENNSSINVSCTLWKPKQAHNSCWGWLDMHCHEVMEANSHPKFGIKWEIAEWKYISQHLYGANMKACWLRFIENF